MLGLSILDCDCDASPTKAADVVVCELGVVAPNHLLDVRHLGVGFAIRDRGCVSQDEGSVGGGRR